MAAAQLKEARARDAAGSQVRQGVRDRRKLRMDILVATLVGVVVVIWPTRAYGKGRERCLDGDAVPETRNPTA